MFLGLAPLVLTAASLLGRKVTMAIGSKALSATFSGGIKGVLTALAKGVAGFVAKVFSAVALVNWVTQTAVFLYNFNWNATDEQLDAQIQANLNQLAGLAGGAFGQSLGWAVCGAVPGAMIAVVNPAAGAYVLKEVGEEAFDELTSVWGNLIKSAAQVATRSFLTWGYKNLRRFLKQPGNLIAKAFFSQEFLDQWGKADSPPLILSKKVEETIESIPNETVREFVENAYEEFWEACSEASFVVANSLDFFAASQQQTLRQNVLGAERVVEITPDRSVPEQRIVLAGNERVLQTSIVQAIATHQLLDNKDVGQIVGQPADDYLRKQPCDLEIIVKFYNTARPPLSRDNRVEATYKIPNVKRSALEWGKIKAACGGATGFTYGPHRITYKLNNNGQMCAYGASHTEAKQLLNSLLTLSDAEILAPLEGSEIEGGNRSKAEGNMKELVQLYPYNCTIIYANPTSDLTKGKKRLSDGKRVVYEKLVFPLWVDSEPVGLDQAIQSLFIE